MTPYVGAAAFVAVFLVCIRLFSLPGTAKEILTTVASSRTAMFDKTLDDRAKESALQAFSKRLFSLFLLLSLGGTASLLLPAGLIWLGSLTGVFAFTAVLEALLSWKFLVGATVVGCLLGYGLRRGRQA
jgi:hypothetical protein